MKKCNCVKFSMPRDDNMTICSQKDIMCYDQAENDLLGDDMRSGVESSEEKYLKQITSCNCLPSCTSINYDAEISQANFDHIEVMRSFGENVSELIDFHLARVTIYFKEAQFITSRRSELYGLTDFMANCGGLLGKWKYLKSFEIFMFLFCLGLFMGVSILSLIEIIYYLSLRFTCNLKYRKKKNITLSESMGNLSEIPHITFEKAD